ncbi:MAG: sigma-54-dependent Fis family transcriptional regulator [Deltaproteobacteria bacterium]|nr:sigma-54-dependent Fis family transcriptional regulator [Deltaproteobacteria bacterium]
MANILIVEDHAALRDALAIALGAQGHKVVTAMRGDAGIRVLEEQTFDLVVTDLKLPAGPDGLAVLEAARTVQPRTPVILMTAHGTMETAVRALRLGALDFIEKPFDIDEMEARIEKALRHGEYVERVEGLREDVLSPYRPEKIVGDSPALHRVLEMVRKVAPTRANILVTGETGTGKELVAGAIHALSPRAQGEFVAVNCAAIPDALLESELFGYERGAFTGAARRRMGRFERAHKGTLFLDEIGDMSPSTQAKILRVLQDGCVERLGGEESVTVDVRVISATHRDLRKEVEAGRFREDLYYRLNVVNLHLPPLRERGDDPVLLARHFATLLCADFKRPPVAFGPEALQSLRAHGWKGNVRELRNAVERAVLLCEGPSIGAVDLGLEERTAAVERDEPGARLKLPPGGISLKEAEKELILAALDRAHWVQKDAAKLLGITKRAMHYKVELYKLTHPSWTKNRPQESE